MRVDIVREVIILGRRIQLLELLDRLLVTETFTVAETRPETAARQDPFEKTCRRNGEVALATVSMNCEECTTIRPLPS